MAHYKQAFRYNDMKSIEKFSISFSLGRLREPDQYDQDYYHEWGPLFQSLRQFLANYSGEFEIMIGDRRLHFNLDPDLSTIFDNIPDILQQLTADTIEPAYLHFFEQATDLMLILERRGAAINIRFYVGDFAGHQFRDLPDSGYEVMANEFLAEWCRFARAVLVALSDFQPELATTADFQAYCARLVSIEGQIR